MNYDFHMHSTFSDGRLHPNDLFMMAKKAGLCAMSITDHDNANVHQRISEYDTQDIPVVSGIEISSEYQGHEVHILGYNFDPFHTQLIEYVEHFKNARVTRIYKMLALAREQGFQLSDEEFTNHYASAGSLGKPHLARYIVEKGYAKDVNEVFEKWLHRKGALYIAKPKIEPEEAVKLLHDIGASVVLAHPGLVRDDDAVRILLELPFDGLEIMHPKHSKEQQVYYRKLAKDKGLFTTGGSDYHAIPGRYPDQLGEWVVSYEDVQEFLSVIHMKRT